MAALYWKVRKDDGTWTWVPAVWDFDCDVEDSTGKPIGFKGTLWLETCTCAKCNVWKEVAQALEHEAKSTA